MIKDIPIQNNITNTANFCKVEESDVEDVVDSMYEFVKNTVESIEFADMDLEQFEKSKKNFNIPGLCKLFVSTKRFKKINGIL